MIVESRHLSGRDFIGTRPQASKKPIPTPTVIPAPEPVEDAPRRESIPLSPSVPVGPDLVPTLPNPTSTPSHTETLAQPLFPPLNRLAKYGLSIPRDGVFRSPCRRSAEAGAESKGLKSGMGGVSRPQPGVAQSFHTPVGPRLLPARPPPARHPSPPTPLRHSGPRAGIHPPSPSIPVRASRACPPHPHIRPSHSPAGPRLVPALSTPLLLPRRGDSRTAPLPTHS